MVVPTAAVVVVVIAVQNYQTEKSTSIYSVFQKSQIIAISSNNSSKSGPILIIFGTKNCHWLYSYTILSYQILTASDIAEDSLTILAVKNY